MGKRRKAGREEMIRPEKEEAAFRAGAETDPKRTDTKKALKRFRLRAPVKTATTYSPTTTPGTNSA